MMHKRGGSSHEHGSVSVPGRSKPISSPWLRTTLQSRLVRTSADLDIGIRVFSSFHFRVIPGSESDASLQHVRLTTESPQPSSIRAVFKDDQGSGEPRWHTRRKYLPKQLVLSQVLVGFALASAADTLDWSLGPNTSSANQCFLNFRSIIAQRNLYEGNTSIEWMFDESYATMRRIVSSALFDSASTAQSRTRIGALPRKHAWNVATIKYLSTI